jgi:hypothetical protein
LLASSSTKAIYYSFTKARDYSSHGGIILAFGAIPAIPSPDQWPEPPISPYITRHDRHSWFYAKAILDGVQAVRKSWQGGLELKYPEFSVSLGNFSPSEAFGWMESPRSFCVNHTDAKRDDVNFFGDEEMFAGELRTMRGSIVIWFNHNAVIIETE